MGTSYMTPAPDPASPTPDSPKPSVFYAALAAGYTDAKTTTDAALNQKLYTALIRPTK